MPITPSETETLGVNVKTEDTPLVLGTVSVTAETTAHEEIPPVPSLPNSYSSEIAPKIEEFSQPDPSCLPPQPWEYVTVARGEEHASIDDLLNCLPVEELQLLVKSLKVKCASKKVRQPSWWSDPLLLLMIVFELQKHEMIKGLLTASSNQSTLSFSTPKAQQKGKNRMTLLSCRDRQINRLRKLVMDMLGGHLRNIVTKRY